MNDTIQISPATRRFNSLVERFDILTLYTKDRHTALQIFRWYWSCDPLLAPQYSCAFWELGYTDLPEEPQATRTETVTDERLYGI